MLRTIAISLVLVLSVGVMLPFANSAHGIRQSTQITQKKSKRHRSRAWWRRYRARLRAIPNTSAPPGHGGRLFAR